MSNELRQPGDNDSQHGRGNRLPPEKNQDEGDESNAAQDGKKTEKGEGVGKFQSQSQQKEVQGRMNVRPRGRPEIARRRLGEGTRLIKPKAVGQIEQPQT